MRRHRTPLSGARTERSSSRRRDDGGAAFVEFLLAMPFLALMVFGIVETGLGWRAVVQVHSAVRAGARVGSKDGNNPSADYDMLLAISAALPSDLKSTTTSNLKIIIFKASSTSGAVPAACLDNANVPLRGVNQVCNIYTANDLTSTNLVASNFGGTVGKYDHQWDPNSRLVNLTADNMDYLGVYISTFHQSQTGFLGMGNYTIQRQVIFRLEPALGT